MVLRIFKVIAISGFLTTLECTKLVFGRGTGPDPLRELTALPRPPSSFKSKGREGEEEGKGEGKGREGTGGTAPLRKFLDPPLG